MNFILEANFTVWFLLGGSYLIALVFGASTALSFAGLWNHCVFVSVTKGYDWSSDSKLRVKTLRNKWILGVLFLFLITALPWFLVQRIEVGFHFRHLANFAMVYIWGPMYFLVSRGAMRTFMKR